MHLKPRFVYHSQMSAAAFAKGLLDLEGQLTPILVGQTFITLINAMLLFRNHHFHIFLKPSKVSLVSKDSSMLDGSENASSEMVEAKVSLSSPTFLPSYPEK